MKQNVEFAKQICPYNKLCTQKPQIPDNASLPEGFISCCPACKCDEKCFEFSDCCPDAPGESNSTSMSKVTCKKAIYKSRSLHDISANKYLMVQNCPKYDNSSTARKCKEVFEQTPTPDDIAVVSDIKDPSRIYANKYCALCNGARKTKRYVLFPKQIVQSISRVNASARSVVPIIINLNPL